MVYGFHVLRGFHSYSIVHWILELWGFGGFFKGLAIFKKNHSVSVVSHF